MVLRRVGQRLRAELALSDPPHLAEVVPAIAWPAAVLSVRVAIALPNEAGGDVCHFFSSGAVVAVMSRLPRAWGRRCSSAPRRASPGVDELSWQRRGWRCP